MAEDLRIGGLPVVTLRAPPQPDAPAIVEATVLPGRGFMLLQAVAALPGGDRLELLEAPSASGAAKLLDGGPDDFAGSRAFSFGGALLAPYANRIRGRALAETREIEAAVDGRTVRLPRNWGGKAPGAETYAMHGLILDAATPFEQPSPSTVTGRLADAFAGRWPGAVDLAFAWRLAGGRLTLEIEARNLGDTPAPIGLGWHPYFRIPSGRRAQAVLRIPAAARAEVNDYDEVLPTGRLLELAGTAYDFRDGRRLGDLYLDDCFTGLAAARDDVVAELTDAAGGLGLRIASPSPPARAVQVYAPPEKPFVVIEPQFNLADPFGAAWPADLDTGMARLAPGDAVTYRVEVTLFRP